MNNIKNEQSPELHEMMQTFPRRLIYWGWLSVLLIIGMLVLGSFFIEVFSIN